MTAMQFLNNVNTDSKLFLLYGQEELFIDKVRKAIADSVGAGELNTDIFDENSSVEQIITVADQMPCFSESRLLILNEPSFLKNKESDSFTEYIKSMPETSKILLVMRSQPDKRRSYFKYFEKNGVIIEAETNNEASVEDWSMRIAKEKGVSVTKQQIRLVIKMCGSDMFVLENEISKLSMLNKRKISDDDIRKVISVSDEYDVFLLHEHMLKKEYTKAFDLTRRIFAEEKTFIPLIALLAGKFSQMLAAKQILLTGKNIQQTADELSRDIKIKPYAAKCAATECKDFTVEALKRSVSMLAEYEFALKSGGVDPGIESLLMKIYSKDA